MRAYVISLLQTLSKDGLAVGDAEIIEWANEKVSNNTWSKSKNFATATHYTNRVFTVEKR